MTDDVASAGGITGIAIDAADVPRHLLKGERSAVCRRCERRFDWGNGAGRGEFDPCPGCGSPVWVRRGYREGAAFVVGEGRTR